VLVSADVFLRKKSIKNQVFKVLKCFKAVISGSKKAPQFCQNFLDLELLRLILYSLDDKKT
jgi:hypothetical protein